MSDYEEEDYDDRSYNDKYGVGVETKVATEGDTTTVVGFRIDGSRYARELERRRK